MCWDREWAINPYLPSLVHSWLFIPFIPSRSSPFQTCRVMATDLSRDSCPCLCPEHLSNLFQKPSPRRKSAPSADTVCTVGWRIWLYYILLDLYSFYLFSVPVDSYHLLCVVTECFPVVLLKANVGWNLLRYVISTPFSQYWTPTTFWQFSRYSKAYKNNQPTSKKRIQDLSMIHVLSWLCPCCFFILLTLFLLCWFMFLLRRSVEAITAKSFWRSRLEVLPF